MGCLRDSLGLFKLLMGFLRDQPRPAACTAIALTQFIFHTLHNLNEIICVKGLGLLLKQVTHVMCAMGNNGKTQAQTKRCFTGWIYDCLPESIIPPIVHLKPEPKPELNKTKQNYARSF